MDFISTWHQAAMTTLGLFWMAFWAFGLGYLISSMIQVFLTRERMQRAMGGDDPRSVALATFFGFASSSCSFAALATTRALFRKGAGLVSSLAFLLASTNLVVELGIIIAVFLSWEFVVGEYVGGLLLILSMWAIVRLTHPHGLVRQLRDEHQEDDAEGGQTEDWRKTIRSTEGWRRVAQRYVMEWTMVWKDVTVGFTVAGIIAAFVPSSFFAALFVGAGESAPTLIELVLQTLVAPVAAFFTFIGSMGNIPLAAVLYENGVSFAGIMAFLFSDLVVFPVLRIQARYYGWKMALYIAGVFLVSLVVTALTLHGILAWGGWLPSPDAVQTVSERSYFAVDTTLFLNLAFLLLSGVFVFWTRIKKRKLAHGDHGDHGDHGGHENGGHGGHEHSGHGHGGAGLLDKILFGCALLCFSWLALGACLG